MSNIANQPHVVVFADSAGRLTPCLAFGRYGTIDPDHKHAIFADRSTADANIRHWEGIAVAYFSVPATVVFPDFGKVDPNAPLTAEQRRALFAAFNEVFGSRSNEGRYVFTNLVLGTPGEIRSWSEHKDGSLTRAEASKVLDTLTELGRVL